MAKGKVGQGGEPAPRCPICHSTAAAIFVQELYTTRGISVIKAIFCMKCYREGRAAIWEISRYNKYADKK